MKTEKNATNTRLILLQAANRIVLEEGVARLTLEAVAKRAGVSKGGLLYHFPNKENLIKGLIDYLNEQFDEQVKQELEREPDPHAPGSWLRAYVRASFAADRELQNSHAALLAAVATDPQLMEPFIKVFNEYQQNTLQTGVDPVIATLVRLATDAQWLLELFNLAPPGGELREKVRDKLLEMTRGDSKE